MLLASLIKPKNNNVLAAIILFHIAPWFYQRFTTVMDKAETALTTSLKDWWQSLFYVTIEIDDGFYVHDALKTLFLNEEYTEKKLVKLDGVHVFDVKQNDRFWFQKIFFPKPTFYEWKKIEFQGSPIWICWYRSLQENSERPQMPKEQKRKAYRRSSRAMVNVDT